jgi:hypothetical protein
MPLGRVASLRRLVGLALARHLRTRPGRMAERGMQPQAIVSVRRWAARLSHPSVQLLVQGDHVVVQRDGELIASGSLLAASTLREPPHADR